LLAESLRRGAASLMTITAPIAVVSLAMHPGGVAAALTLPWLASCVLVSLSGLLELVAVRPFALEGILRSVATGYLTFGAGWFFLSRLGVRPLDFPDAVVELTGVHFHFAGFAAVLVACTAAARGHGRAPGRFAIAGAVGAVAAMPIIALGITYSTKLAAMGASLIGVSLVSVAIAQITMIARDELRPAAKALLGLSSLSVVAAMVLAVQYTMGQAFDTPALTIDQMARTHGILNGAGFMLLGLLGWHLERRRAGSS